MRERSEENSYSFEASFPELTVGDSTALAATNKAINEFVIDILERFRADSISQSAEKQRLRKEHGVMAWEDLSITHEVSLFTREVLSVEFQLVSCHSMAAHPNHFTRTLNLSLFPAKRLDLNDIFKSSTNYLQVLSDYCVADLERQKIERWHDPKERHEQLKSGEDDWILSGAGPRCENYKNLVLAKGGVRLFFDEYQVGSYAAGRYEVFIPTHVLEPVLNEPMVGRLGQL